jgi:hypothetical protein
LEQPAPREMKFSLLPIQSVGAWIHGYGYFLLCIRLFVVQDKVCGIFIMLKTADEGKKKKQIQETCRV